MRPWRLRHIVRQIQRTAVAVLFAISYFVSIVGVPLPPVVLAQEVAPAPSGHVCPCAPQGGCAQPCCCCVPESNEDEVPAVEAKAASWGLAMKARECHGLDTEWVAGGAALPPPGRVTWAFEWNQLDNIAVAATDHTVVSTIPPDPPPRMS